MPSRKHADPTAITFGSYLRMYRMERGMTLEDVAEKVPTLDPGYLGELERGWHVPRLTTCKRLADALDVSLSELVSGL
jgi:transcriptional regulator with XRE-family HTH domain